ncbi:MAG: hypothetical protein ACOC5G_02685 [Acidobacteriota bacterium]
MKRGKSILFFGLIIGMALFFSCQKASDESDTLLELPVDSLDNIISKSDVQFVKDVSKDGNGSLRIDADEAKFVRLYEIDNIDLEYARLKYKAEVKTENFAGETFLEMWCFFEGKGRFFSRGLDSTLSGTNDWTNLETVFLLKRGENPDKVELDLVINGSGGTIWVDAIRIEKAKL